MSKLLVPALALILGAAGGAAATLVIDRIHAVDPASEARAGEDMVRALLAREPELVVESIRAWQAKQQTAELEAQGSAIRDSEAALVADGRDPVVGPADAAVTVVQFFDYRCPYCRRAMGTVDQLIEKRDDIRVVYKEFPILGPDSLVAARAALAVNQVAPKAYPEIHTALMTQQGSLTEDRVLAIVADRGVDAEAVKARMHAPETEAHIRDTMDLARKLGIGGTPAFVIGDTLLPGAVELDALDRAIEAAKG
jgi:protein-disulfide isomerase